MIFVNFKTYQEGTGVNALALVETLETIAKETSSKIIPVVQPLDLKEAVDSSVLEIWVQKIDPVTFGAHTGSIVAEGVREDGAIGTFLNHSEAKFKEFAELEMAVTRAKEVGLKTLIFASSLEELKQVLTLKPTYVAYEPPEFIGKTDTSVAGERPEIISDAARLATEAGIPLIVGAGIHSKEDVAKSIELGAVGVAVATDIVKASDPKKEVLDLLAGFGN